MFLNCHAFKLWDVNADYDIFTVTHSELFILTRRIQYLGLKPHLSSVLGARSSAIAFPGRPGLTRNRFSPPRITPSRVPQSSASRKQIPVARSWSAGPAPTSLPLRQRSRRCSAAPARCAVSVTATSGRFAASDFPREAGSWDLELGEPEPLSIKWRGQKCFQ